MGRKVKHLTVRDEFLILTNGKRSEKNYFECIRALNKSIYKIKVEFLNSDPEKLVKYAIEKKSKSNRVWCVFDKDEFKEDSLNRAFQAADKNDIGIAFSNMAFEVWLIDHFKECAGEKTAAQLIGELDTILKNNNYNAGYSKEDKSAIGEMYIPRLNEAVHNADVAYQKLVAEYSERGFSASSIPIFKINPYTDVHKLITELKLENKS